MMRVIEKMKIGFIVNPIAGMGGAVGLKGTDGAEILAEAIVRGAVPRAPGRAQAALAALSSVKNDILLLAGPGVMGADLAVQAGFSVEVIGEAHASTTPADTRAIASQMKAEGAALLLFAGGDGTARDIHAAVGEGMAVIGIPAGVKIHSAVFGRNPALAGETAALWVKGGIANTIQAEVMDINEADYRREVLSAKLYGYLCIPAERKRLQRLKCGSAGREQHAQEAIAHDLAERLQPDRLYLVGAGSTTRPLMQLLGLAGSLLGVDAVKNGQLIGRDLTEREILDLLAAESASLIVTPIGGQGYVFGRGNLQISPAVLHRIKKQDIHILATPAKIHGLTGAPLLLDTGDSDIDKILSGHYRVVTGYHQHIVYRVSG